MSPEPSQERTFSGLDGTHSAAWCTDHPGKLLSGGTAGWHLCWGVPGADCILTDSAGSSSVDTSKRPCFCGMQVTCSRPPQPKSPNSRHDHTHRHV